MVVVVSSYWLLLARALMSVVNNHTKKPTTSFFQRCAREYRVLLAEVITAEAAARVTDDGKTVLTSWSEGKKLLRPDPRYSKMPSKDRESLWSRHADDLRRKLKSASDPKERSDVETKVRASSTDLGGRSPKRSRSSRQM